MKNNSPLEKVLNKPVVVFPTKQVSRTDQSLTVRFEASVSTLRRRNSQKNKQKHTLLKTFLNFAGLTVKFSSSTMVYELTGMLKNW